MAGQLGHHSDGLAEGALAQYEHSRSQNTSGLAQWSRLRAPASETRAIAWAGRITLHVVDKVRSASYRSLPWKPDSTGNT